MLLTNATVHFQFKRGRYRLQRCVKLFEYIPIKSFLHKIYIKGIREQIHIKKYAPANQIRSLDADSLMCILMASDYLKTIKLIKTVNFYCNLFFIEFNASIFHGSFARTDTNELAHIEIDE